MDLWDTEPRMTLRRLRPSKRVPNGPAASDGRAVGMLRTAEATAEHGAAGRPACVSVSSKRVEYPRCVCLE